VKPEVRAALEADRAARAAYKPLKTDTAWQEVADRAADIDTTHTINAGPTSWKAK
jgi:hypothetical protein